MTDVKPIPAVSRAAWRMIDAGSSDICPHCNEKVAFSSQNKDDTRTKVICNIYVDGKWSHVEHFHRQCYLDANEPYGSGGPLKKSAAGFAGRKRPVVKEEDDE